MDDDTAFRWMTYAELGQSRGISTASATRLAFRRRWRRQVGNDKIARVAVPAGEDQPRHDDKHDDRDDDKGDSTPAIRAFEVAVSSLTEAREQAEKRAEQAQIIAETERSRADQAESRASQAEARATRAEGRADQERLRADDLRGRLEVADGEARKAQDEAEVLRRANDARRALSRWARLRAAWRGE